MKKMNLKKERKIFLLNSIPLQIDMRHEWLKVPVRLGGGTMPDVELPSYTALLKHKILPTDHIARQLRTEFSPGTVVRIRREEFIIDLRTVT